MLQRGRPTSGHQRPTTASGDPGVYSLQTLLLWAFNTCIL